MDRWTVRSQSRSLLSSLFVVLALCCPRSLLSSLFVVFALVFIELRAHSCFSFSDGAISAEVLARHARRLGYSHLGVTDTADLGGLARFATEAMSPLKDPTCTNADDHDDTPCRTCQYPVRPIVGAELNVDGHPAAFLARNQTGYCNLAALVTLARVGQWATWEKPVQARRRGRPKITWEQLAAHSDGLHALTGPATGELASLVRAGKTAAAEQCLTRWREVFEDDSRFSIEVRFHNTGGRESALATELIELAERTELPWFATQDPRYADESGRLVHDMLTADLSSPAGSSSR